MAVVDYHQFRIRVLRDEVIGEPLQAARHLHAQFVHARQVVEILHWTDYVRDDSVRETALGKTFVSPEVTDQFAPLFSDLFLGVDSDRPIHDQVGGLARTEVRDGYRFDLGGHRFFTKSKEVDDLWHEVMKEEFLRRPRLSRIYWNGKFLDYPLNGTDVIKKLGPIELARCLASYLWAAVKQMSPREAALDLGRHRDLR